MLAVMTRSTFLATFANLQVIPVCHWHTAAAKSRSAETSAMTNLLECGMGMYWNNDEAESGERCAETEPVTTVVQ